MKKIIMDRIVLIITVFVILVLVYMGYVLINRVNVKRTIRKDIYEVLNDYQINNKTKNLKIIIHSKTNYSTRISYNVVFTNDGYDKLEFEQQKEIIKYIKKISFKGNNKKYFINKVTIYSKKNKYEYATLFKKNGKMYGVGEIDTNSTAENIKEKLNEIKEKFTG